MLQIDVVLLPSFAENTNTTAQLMDFAGYFERTDPYDHPVVVHTFPGQYEQVYRPLVGSPLFEGPSLQLGNMRGTHAETIRWLDAADDAGRPTSDTPSANRQEYSASGSAGASR